MLHFLKQTRKFVNAKEATCIILGNESCDLDSACSALCLAYACQTYPNVVENLTKAKQFLPVLNIPRQDYPLKTEVKHLLSKHQIPESALSFRDELKPDFLAHSDFILVDHHVSPFTAQSVAIYDHRPRETNINIPEKCFVNMELVGSCATLIAEIFLQQHFDEDMRSALEMLRSTIVLDTVNFAPNAARFTEKDQNICCQIESLLEACTAKQPAREELFEELRKARADVSSLTSAQLLRKDLKFLRDGANKLCVALPGFPLPVQQFIKKSDAEVAVRSFAEENACDLVLLLGMYVREDDGSVERDIGLITIRDNIELRDVLESKLLEFATSGSTLNLEKYSECDFMQGHFYIQRNIKATRKHILPIVKEVLETWQK